MKITLRLLAPWLLAVAIGCGGSQDEPNIMHTPYDAAVDSRDEGTTSDSSDAADGKGDEGCRAGSRLMYKTPGCGANAPAPECGPLDP